MSKFDMNTVKGAFGCLECLHLDIVRWSPIFTMREATPLDIAKEFLAAQDFWPWLVEDWLPICILLLRELEIRSETEFGHFFTLGKLNFLSLTSLTLDNMAFGTDEQMKWMFSLRMLRKLRLFNCSIIYCANLRESSDDEKLQDSEHVVQKCKLYARKIYKRSKYRFMARWSEFFLLARAELHELVDFRFFGQRNDLTSNSPYTILPSRYRKYNEEGFPWTSDRVYQPCSEERVNSVLTSSWDSLEINWDALDENAIKRLLKDIQTRNEGSEDV